MSGRVKCNYKRSLECIAANRRLLTVKNVAEWLRSGNRQYQKSIKRQN